MGRSTGLEPANAGATIQSVDHLHHDRHLVLALIILAYFITFVNREGRIGFEVAIYSAFRNNKKVRADEGSPMLPTVFIDIDDTLIVPHTKLSLENATAITRYVQAGGEIVFATGKVPVALYQLIKDLNLADRYHIGGNGAVLFNLVKPDFHLLAHVGEKSESIIKKSVALELPGFVYTADQVFSLDPNYAGDLDHLFTDLGEPRPERLNGLDYAKVIKVLYLIKTSEKSVEKLVNQELGPYLNELQLIRTAEYLLEVHHQSQTKAQAAKAYCELHNIDIKSCYAIGDSENDLPLLKAVGHPYIVGNASQLLYAANYPVLASCRDHGVAELLNRLLNQ